MKMWTKVLVAAILVGSGEAALAARPILRGTTSADDEPGCVLRDAKLVKHQGSPHMLCDITVSCELKTKEFRRAEYYSCPMQDTAAERSKCDKARKLTMTDASMPAGLTKELINKADMGEIEESSVWMHHYCGQDMGFKASNCCFDEKGVQFFALNGPVAIPSDVLGVLDTSEGARVKVAVRCGLDVAQAAGAGKAFARGLADSLPRCDGKPSKSTPPESGSRTQHPSESPIAHPGN